jgi:hypothetical protein
VRVDAQLKPNAAARDWDHQADLNVRPSLPLQLRPVHSACTRRLPLEGLAAPGSPYVRTRWYSNP